MATCFLKSNSMWFLTMKFPAFHSATMYPTMIMKRIKISFYCVRVFLGEIWYFHISICPLGVANSPYLYLSVYYFYLLHLVVSWKHDMAKWILDHKGSQKLICPKNARLRFSKYCIFVIFQTRKWNYFCQIILLGLVVLFLPEPSTFTKVKLYKSNSW